MRVLGLLVVLLPLGTTPMEGATLLVAGAALLSPRRGSQPLLAPALVLLAALSLAAAEAGLPGLWAAALATWAWALVVALPPLVGGLSAHQRQRLETWGLGAAALAGLWALVEVGLAGAPPWEHPVDGPFSHHLTLGYALLPPLGRALHRRRWALALPIALGVGAAGGSGPLLGAAVLGLALVAPPPVALGAGVLAALGVFGLLRGDAELAQRAVLWTSGAAVLDAHPLGVGVLDARPALSLAQHQLVPGFHFPLHAHDSALQLGVVGGLGAWLGAGWLLLALWRCADRGGRAALAALIVGGLTQDTLGDLEVVRALCAWALLPAGSEPAGPTAVGTPASPAESRP